MRLSSPLSPANLAYLNSQGWGQATACQLPQDASSRRYTRLQRPQGGPRHALLMEMPLATQQERASLQQFIIITNILNRWNLSAPRLYHQDRDNPGRLLIEDLGLKTYRYCLAKGMGREFLYRLAIDALVAIYQRYRQSPPPLNDYRQDGHFRYEHMLFVNWHCPAVGIDLSEQARTDYDTIWDQLLTKACEVPATLILRDYHIDNLIYIPRRRGVRACGLIDFQDAVAGPCVYDLASLLYDVRTDVSPDQCDRLKDYFFRSFVDTDAKILDDSCMIVSTQRLFKIAGIFVRLIRQDGKQSYYNYLPRVWDLLIRHLEHPALAPMRAWCQIHIPCMGPPPTTIFKS